MIFLPFAAWMVSSAALFPPAVCPVSNSVGRCVMFTMERQGMPTPKYTIVVREDRKALYWKGDRADGPLPAPDLSVGEATKDVVFRAVSTIDKGKCETHLKGIAQTGQKTLSSFEGDETSTCVFNYSDDESINAATAALQAMAETMDLGEQLSAKHRFDRLALDALMETLVEEVKSHRAIELQNIAPILHSLVDDERVIDRVRRKAARLLQDAVVEAPLLPDKPL